MTQLSTNLRTHICYIKEGNDERELHITKTQYDIIREDVENLKMNDFYKITDIDNGKILFDGQRKDILRFKEKNISGGPGYKVICDYGNKHDLINGGYNCDCFQKYGFYAIDLKQWAKDNKKSMYSQDWTEDDKRECWKSLKVKGVI